MRRRLLTRGPSPAMLVAIVALVSSMTGGAVAAKLITGDDIAKNAVKSKHIKNKGVKGKDLKRNAVKSGHVRDGSLLSTDFKADELPAGETGPQGPDGPKGADGADGADGAEGAEGAEGADGADGTARAYALVIPGGVATAFDAARTKNFTAVNEPAAGRYCLTPAAGIDPGTVATVASPERGGSSGDNTRFVWVWSSGGGCAAGQFEVRVYDETGTLRGDTAFTLIVP